MSAHTAYTALINPIAAGGVAPRTWEPVERRLRASGADVTVQTTHSREHAVEQAGLAAARGDIVVAVGGDGLARDATTGVVPHGGRLALLPAGRGNDLVRCLDLPQRPVAVADALLAGRTRAVDVLQVGDVYVPGNVYAGIDAAATQIINANRWLPAAALYRLAPIRAVVSWRPPTYRIRLDGTKSAVRAHTVVVANSGAYGHGLQIVPSARVDDARAHVLVIPDVPRWEVARYLAEARTGAHVRRPQVTVRAAHTVELDADRPLPVCADGDQIGTLPVTVTIRPGALRLVVPA